MTSLHVATNVLPNGSYALVRSPKTTAVPGKASLTACGKLGVASTELRDSHGPALQLLGIHKCSPFQCLGLQQFLT